MRHEVHRKSQQSSAEEESREADSREYQEKSRIDHQRQGPFTDGRRQGVGAHKAEDDADGEEGQHSGALNGLKCAARLAE
jgi:hypothetical protein